MKNALKNSEELILPFFQLMQCMDSVYEDYARKNNLTYMSMYILETLFDEKECTQKKISEITLYPKQTVNMVIQSFIRKKWVVLLPVESDKRTKYVKLTEEGESFAKKILIPFRDATGTAFAELDSDRREIMMAELSALIRSFADKVKKIKTL